MLMQNMEINENMKEQRIMLHKNLLTMQKNSYAIMVSYDHFQNVKD